ncbi:MAG: helix-turn-helix transcriptional regulator [Porphyromonadaceae bacterium]|nr:helix-turn-helix transcriptional regulator [Porphyromonadaceae bacterium]
MQSIKNLIKRKGLTNKEVAQRMGISEVGLSQHLNGNPSYNVLERIAGAIGVELSDLFDPNQPIFGVIVLNGVTYQIETFGQLERMYNDYLKQKKLN